MSPAVGFAFPTHRFGADRIAPSARFAAGAGLTSIWAGETRGLEAFTSLAAAGAAAPELGLGTGVVALQLRGPLVTAMAAATLQALHPEREVHLGFGVSGRAVVENWHGGTFGDRPVRQVREFIEVLRLCFAGEPFSYSGEHYTLHRSRMSVPLPGRTPQIVIGALNQRMLQLAGEAADGVLLNAMPATAVGWAVEQVRAGEARAGRPPGSCRVHAFLRLGIGDAERRLATGRQSLFGYVTVDGYTRAFVRAGFGADVEASLAAHRAGDRQAALDALSFEMVDSIETVGDERRVAQALQEYLDAGVESPVIVPLLDDERLVESFEQVLSAAVGAVAVS